MKILYDHQIFSSQVYGGISRYFYELMRSYSHDSEVDFELALYVTNNSYLRSSEFALCKPFFPGRKFFGRTTLINMLNGLLSRQRLRNRNFDIFHPTYYNPYYLQFVGTRPVVVTVYDMTHELYPDLFPADRRTVAWKKVALESATGIIAISENTKKDLLEFYSIDEKCITVIPLACSPPPVNLHHNSSNVPEKFFLFVGQRWGYKNFIFFIKTFVSILRDYPEICVVCAGGGSFTPQEICLLSSLGILDRVRQYPVDDNSLAELYRKAVAFVFPSLYEGFGIPVLEAFSAGCPVILSNRSSLPEVAGGAAIYFEPDDAQSLRSAVVKIVNDVSFRDSLRKLGHERLRAFSWARVAHETKIVYEGLL